MIQPMFNALYPRYSRLVVSDNWNLLIKLYHLSNQCLVAVVAAISAILIVFSKDVIYLWTNDHQIADAAFLPLSVLVAGTALNGLMNLPYALQLAHGWTRLAVGTNFVALVLGIPFCIWAVGRYGATGAACVWLAFNLGNFLINVPLMHRRLLRNEMNHWYVRDILPAFAAATAIVLPARLLVPTLTRTAHGVIELATICLLTLLATSLALGGSPCARLDSSAVEKLTPMPAEDLTQFRVLL